MTDYRWLADPASVGTRLDKFLAAVDRLGSRGRASDALTRGKVFLNDAEAGPREGSRRLAAGDRVRVWADRPGSAKKKALRSARAGELNIVYEDEALIVVNKPPGILSVRLERQEDAASVEDELVGYLRSKGKRRPLVVHRIDRDTSGLVVFAKRPDAQTRLRGQFRRREPERLYLAVVYGRPSPSSGTWRDHLVWDEKVLVQKETHRTDPRGLEAVSHYRVRQVLGDATLLEVRLETGRRNQIRLQARLHGHTLVGETRYTYGPDRLRPFEFPRQALHAWRLAFSHPLTGLQVQFEAPLPADMEGLIKNLSKR